MNISTRAYHLLKSSVSVYRRSHLTSLPVRMVHPRGYNDYYDMWSFKFHEANMALMGCKTSEQFGFIFKKYGENMTDV